MKPSCLPAPLRRPVIALLSTFLLALVCATAQATDPALPDAPVPAGSTSIPFDEIGARATADYKGDANSITPTSTGAALRAGFQKLAGSATAEGLTLHSTCDTEAPGSLRLAAAAIGRTGAVPVPLPATGTLTVSEKLVAWTRSGLVEEYSVSVDGVRQDFIVPAAPAGSGGLNVELSLTGAHAEAAATAGGGIHLTFQGSTRRLSYARLHVADATGKSLPATLDVLNPDRLAVRVDDAGAVYPVRIDPTFSDADWVSLNPLLPGVDSTVYALAVDDSGALYVGGDFTVAGGVATRGIAKWDGTAWAAVGSGVNGAVNALAVSGSTVYAGGSFTTAGGVAANRIAKWDGTAWSALGSGMNGTVRALAVSGGDVYAGGDFTTAGGVAASKIAKWDGTAWSTLGSGVVNDRVNALAVSGSTVYAGGYFTTAGGGAANRIAKWDGTAWSALGSGVDSQVNALAVSGNTLYAGGNFTTAGGGAANRIAKWDGTAWSALGSGVDSQVNALAVSGSTLYAGGNFTTAGGVAANFIAKWDGTAWSALGSGVGQVLALAVSGSTVYAGGFFTTAGGAAANSIAKWDGAAWSALGQATGVNGVVNALVVSGSDLYAAGYFTTSAGGVSGSRIAKWDGTAWSALGSGVNGPVNALAVSGSTVYAGGSFTTAGGVAASCIAKWDGAAWSALGSGISGRVNALAVSGSDVYAGGDFSTAGGVAANSIAKWDGTTWSALGSGLAFRSYPVVYALAVSGDHLYVGGSFTTAGGVSASHIARWNGTTWFSMGSGMSGSAADTGVYALAVSGCDVFAGGMFSTPGGVAATLNIARWNGTAWSSLGSGVGSSSSTVSALAMSGSDVIAGGDFVTAGGVAARGIAKWDGTAWSALGSGVNGGVNALAAGSAGEVYVGGNFSIAGSSTVSPYVVQARMGLGGHSTTTDTDGDGLNDAAEYRLAGLGFDWRVAQPALVAILRDNVALGGYYTPAQMQPMQAGVRFAERDPVSGLFSLELGLQKSDALQSWVPFPYLAPQTSVTPEGTVRFNFTLPKDKGFIRLTPAP